MHDERIPNTIETEQFVVIKGLVSVLSVCKSAALLALVSFFVHIPLLHAEQATVLDKPLLYQAEYDAKMYGSHVTVRQNLSQLADGNYEVLVAAKAFYGSYRQRSVFALESGMPKPMHFHVEQKMIGMSRSKKYDTTFKPGMAHFKKRKSSADIKVPDDVQDILSVQLLLRRWLSEGEKDVEFPVLSKAKLKQYRFKVVEEAVLQIPAGRFNAVKVARIGASKTYGNFWFAKDWDYMLLKVESLKGKGKIESMEFRSGVIGGQKIKAL
ncbi:MAG: DUF3108 domain-containing protein [Pseudomonadales bacterium]|nr:DUF3108 domain-containing protein [Pseudomonadales bacterium]